MVKFAVVSISVVLGVLLAICLFGIAGAFVETSREAHVPSVSEYPYSVGGDTPVIFCKSVDAEKRIAYDCIRGDPGTLGFTIQEFHMTYKTNWVKR